MSWISVSRIWYGISSLKGVANVGLYVAKPSTFSPESMMGLPLEYAKARRAEEANKCAFNVDNLSSAFIFAFLANVMFCLVRVFLARLDWLIRV